MWEISGSCWCTHTYKLDAMKNHKKIVKNSRASSHAFPSIGNAIWNLFRRHISIVPSAQSWCWHFDFIRYYLLTNRPNSQVNFIELI